MVREVIARGATIEEAMQNAANELGVEQIDCLMEILETPKRSLFGRNKEAVVKATLEVEEEAQAKNDAPNKNVSRETNHVISQSEEGYEPTEQNEKKLALATVYLQEILNKMGLSDITMHTKIGKEGATITFGGESMAVLIGHHGETLDALQYLVALTCNRTDGEYYRVTLDCGNYRAKREETLKGLATRIAIKVKKSGRSQILEPMNPYERRIIHAVVSEISGVFSKSKGEEPNRRVVILSETPVKPSPRGNNNTRGNGNVGDRTRKPYVHKPERTMEEILKGDVKEKVDGAELYSKIEL